MTRQLKSTTLALSLIFAFGALANAQSDSNETSGTKFVMDNVKNSVSFKSEAPLEDFVGTSNEITGHIYFDPANPNAGGSGSFSIPVMSLNTGIPMRNEHLQGADWLNAEDHPNITFAINSVKTIKESNKKEGATTYDIVLVGDFTIHGITKTLEIGGKFTYFVDGPLTKMQGGGNLLIARADFPITLSDFDVPPGRYKQIIGSKVGESVSVSVKLIGKATP